jgi:hypothetical protein
LYYVVVVRGSTFVVPVQSEPHRDMPNHPRHAERRTTNPERRTSIV